MLSDFLLGSHMESVNHKIYLFLATFSLRSNPHNEVRLSIFIAVPISGYLI